MTGHGQARPPHQLVEVRGVLLGRALSADVKLRRAHPVLAEELDAFRRALVAGVD